MPRDVRTSVPHVPRALRASVAEATRPLRASTPHVLCALRALVRYMHFMPRALHASCANLNLLAIVSP